MPRIDLNIVGRGNNSSAWTASNEALSTGDLDRVMEQKTDNSGALNSLPTPFARFFVAREAFRRVHEEFTHGNAAGRAYSKMVSDILDVYELLFNKKYHENNTWRNGQGKLHVREWNSEEQLAVLKERMPVLYNSLNDYYQDDIGLDKLYFIVYESEGKEMLLACTSPITGFVTPPDMDQQQPKDGGVRIVRKSGGEYFRDLKLFEQRDADFKNYMYQMFGQEGLSGKLSRIRDYVRAFHGDVAIRADYAAQTRPVLTDDNDDLMVNGLSMKQLDEEDVQSYFLDTIVRLPYRIASNQFRTLRYARDDQRGRNYDYLMPFRPEVCNLNGGQLPDADIRLGHSVVTVTLRYNGKEYKREYYKDADFGDNAGCVVEVAADSTLCLSLFPNVRSTIEKENNYFKVMLLGDEDRVGLRFFRCDGGVMTQIDEVQPASTAASFGSRPAVTRSAGTQMYELFNTAFDLIEVSINGHAGLVEPLWPSVPQVRGLSFTYAIDLGTSNTFISQCQNRPDGTPDTSMAPEQFTMNDAMVSYLQEIPPANQQYPFNSLLLQSLPEDVASKVQTEWVPAIIDGSSYRFPIRTAMCSQYGVRDKRLFDSHNIAFFYEKTKPCDRQEISTDIKWSKHSEAELKIFVQELLLIIKCDILQRGGTLARTRLVWFSPLSFSGNILNMYKSIWERTAEQVLQIDSQRINRYSESEAPYYYYRKRAIIDNADAVAVVDIGGGSTDFVYFRDNKPVTANSVHFGCDVLWGNGHNEFANGRENGIFLRYSQGALDFGQRTDLSEINTGMIGKRTVKTKDIINFWITNDEHCNIISSIAGDFRPVFVYHLTTILYYMASMLHDNGHPAPRTIVFSGNGSKYIDSFITQDSRVLAAVIDLVFRTVYGDAYNTHVHIQLPAERKEATCYGGLYRDQDADGVPTSIYHGIARDYESVADLNSDYSALRNELLDKYAALAELYKDVLAQMVRSRIMDATDNSWYIEKARESMDEALDTHYKDLVRSLSDDDIYADSVFFIPIVKRIFEMTLKDQLQ